MPEGGQADVRPLATPGADQAGASRWPLPPGLEPEAGPRSRLVVGLLAVLAPLGAAVGLFVALLGDGFLAAGPLVAFTAVASTLVAYALALRGRVELAGRLAVAIVFAACVAALVLPTVIPDAIAYPFFVVPIAMSSLLLSAWTTAGLSALAIAASLLVASPTLDRGSLAIMVAMVGGLLTVGPRLRNLYRERIRDQNRRLERMGAWLHEAQRVSDVGAFSWRPGGDSWWSPKVYRILGYEPGEIEASLDAFRTHVHPEDQEAFEQVLQRSLSDPDGGALECRLIRKDGKTADVLWQTSLVHAEEGRPRVVGALQDVTERKEHDSLQRRFAVERARTRSLQHTVQIASHEFREPVRTVMTSVQRLGRQAGSEDELGRELEPIEKAGRRLQRVIDALVEFTESLARPLEPEAVGVTGAVDEALGNVRADHEGELEVEIDELPRVWADPSFLVRIFEELFANALEHGSPPVSLEAEPLADQWEIVVRDQGPGIPEDYRDRAFRPFERLAREGWEDHPGLGLTLARRIAERHGGTVEARRAAHGGTEIVVRLPRVDRHPSGEPVLPPMERGEATA